MEQLKRWKWFRCKCFNIASWIACLAYLYWNYVHSVFGTKMRLKKLNRTFDKRTWINENQFYLWLTLLTLCKNYKASQTYLKYTICHFQIDDIQAKICWLLEDFFSVVIFRLPRCFQDVFVFKTTWKTRNCYAEDAFKTSLQDVFKICLDIVFQTSGRPTKCLLGKKLYLILTNLNLYLTNLYVTNLYLTNLRWIQGKSKMHK